MKEIIISSFLLIGVFSYPQTSTTSDVPSTEIEPYYSSGDSELEAKGYTKSPKSYPTEKLYVPSYTNRTSAVVEKLQNNSNEKTTFESDDTASKIADYQKGKIDINGGYTNVKDAYDLQEDGTYKPKYDIYKPGVNNEKYNQALKTQEQIKTYKSVKKEAKDVLPIILLVFLIIASIYLILFLRKRLKH